ncbi:MAG: radical SAM protein [Nitrospirota bacterium]
MNNDQIYHIEDVHYMVSLFCPGECINCNVWRKTIDKTSEIDIGLFERILQCEALKGARHFELTAGESQLSPNYVDVVRLICEYKPEAFIHTNISGWYPEKHLEVVKGCLRYVKPQNFRVDISLDGQPENYSKVRLKKDGWQKAVKTATLLKDLGIIVRFVFVAYKQNFRDIEWIVNFAGKMGVGYYIGFPRETNYFDNVGKIVNSKNFTEDELKYIEETLQKIGYLDGKRKSLWLWAKSVYKNEVPFFDCYMGRRAIVIDPYGNVYPCSDLKAELFMGSLKDCDGDLDGLLSTDKALQAIELVVNKSCQLCTMMCAHKIVFPWGPHTGM